MARYDDLSNKVVFITGAAQGIGSAIAEEFAKQGSTLLLYDLASQNEKLEELTTKLNAYTEATYATGNVVDKKDIEITVDAVVKESSRIDILVNNAGITRDSLFVRMKDEDWDSVMDVNLKGTKNCCEVMIKQMLKNKIPGSIINLASVVGLYGSAGQANYAASKAGVIALTKSLAKEYGGKGIRVNAIAPGFIETAMTEKIPETQRNAMLKAISLKRPGTPQDVAYLTSFLASDRSNYITGSVISLDGGLRMV